MLRVLAGLLLVIGLGIGLQLSGNAHDVWSAASAEPISTVDLSGSGTAVGERNVFTKFIISSSTPFSQQLPFNFIGLSGSASLHSTSRNLAQFLLTIWVSPDGRCPQTGQRFFYYRDIYAAYPQAYNFMNYILKLSEPGTVQIPITFTSPVKVPFTGCVFTVLDGGDPVAGDTVTLTSDLRLLYDTDPAPSPAPFIMGLDDEFFFCSGQSEWLPCRFPSPTITGDLAFARILPITQRLHLWSMTGNVSSAAFTGPPYAHPPQGDWTVNSDYYIYKNCDTITSTNKIAENPPTYGLADYYSSIPADALNILSVQHRGKDVGAVQQEVHKLFSSVELEPGNCLVHLVKASASGAIDSEGQMQFFVQPVVATTASPTSTPTAISPPLMIPTATSTPPISPTTTTPATATTGPAPSSRVIQPGPQFEGHDSLPREQRPPEPSGPSEP